MSLELRAIPESGSTQVRQFLRGVFDSPDDALYIAPAQMHWKYWEPHPNWTGSRSYAYIDDAGDIAAHACAWPFGLRTTDAMLFGAHPIDWAAGMKIPGVGALLLRQIRSLRDISCCIGGTEIAQKVIRQTGFKPVATMKSLALPLRPLRQAFTHQRVNWKLPARFVRNTAWKMKAGSPPPDWSASIVEAHEIHVGLLPAPSDGLAVPVRSVALFEYLAKCPTADYQVWLVRHGREHRGYFLLSLVPGQARIADAWVTAPAGVEEWRALYALAIQAAREHRSSAELTTSGTLAVALEGAIACGFRQYTEEQVMMFDPKKQLASIERFHLQMIDNDMSFLHGHRPDYVT
ncbi:MAG TPA: hypothetical protein VGL53_11825 [Bryobacteraceae bacterium]|jgi:hypothetical protein